MTQRAITVLLTAITGPYVANMGRAATATASVGTAATGAKAKTGLFQREMGALGGKFLAAGGIVYGLNMVVDKVTAYEDALVGVGKTTGLTGSALSDLGAELTGLARKIEGSAEEMLGIAQTAAQLGVAQGDILEFTEVIAGMASATSLTAESAATDMARLSNIMQLPISDVERLGSTIVDLGNNMATTEPEILSMAQRVASAGSSAGMTASEVLGLSAAMSSLGLEAEAGGSAMSMTLVKIQEAALTGGEELDTFARMAGMSADQFAEAWRADPVEALQAFLEGLGQFADQGGNTVEVLDAIGLDGLRVSDTLRRLSGNTELVATATGLANDAYRDNVALADEVETANKRASVAIDNLGDAWDELVRSVAGGGESGESGAGWITTLADAAALGVDAIRGLVEGLDAGLAAVDDFIEPFVGLAQIIIDNDWTVFDESWMGASYKAGESMSEMAERLGIVQTYTADARTEMDLIKDATGSYRGAVDDAAVALQEQAEAALEAYEASVLLADQLLADTDPMFAYARAADNVAEAEQAAADAIEEHGASSSEAEAAVLELFEAELKLDASALKVGDSADIASGHIDRLARNERLAGEEADIARGAVDRLGESARGVAGSYTIRFSAEAASADRVLRSMQQRYGGERAAGGPVEPSSHYLVGEKGPELFVPNVAGRIVTAAQTSQMMGGGGTSVREGDTYQIYAPEPTAKAIIREARDTAWMDTRLVS